MSTQILTSVLHACVHRQAVYSVHYIVCTAAQAPSSQTADLQFKSLSFLTGMAALCPPAAQCFCKALNFQQLEWKLLGCGVCTRDTPIVRIQMHPTEQTARGGCALQLGLHVTAQLFGVAPCQPMWYFRLQDYLIVGMVGLEINKYGLEII